MLRRLTMLARPLALALAGMAGATAVAPGAVLADNPGIGQLVVAGDHSLPGEQLRITGYDLDPGAELTFRLVAPAMSVDLDKAIVAEDGSVAASGLVPASFPLGYAQVIATANGGEQWTTTVLIGERAERPGGQLATPFGGIDPIALAMVGLGVVLLAIALVWYSRGRRRSGSPTG